MEQPVSDEQAIVLVLAAHPITRVVHAMVGRRLTYCGRDGSVWERWGTNVVRPSAITCTKCRRTVERKEDR